MIASLIAERPDRGERSKPSPCPLDIVRGTLRWWPSRLDRPLQYVQAALLPQMHRDRRFNDDMTDAPRCRHDPATVVLR
jgi:hypothetical protein